MIGTRERVRWRGQKGDYDRHILLIRRLHCEECDRIHHELPDCLVPFKRYEAEVIESVVVLGATAEMCGISDHAVYRFRGWWKAMQPYFMHILETLAAKYGLSFGKPPAFREIVRAVANSNNWTFAHRLSTRSGVCPN